MTTEQNKMGPRAKILTSLFAAYGQAGDTRRVAIYAKMLEDYPDELLDMAVKKAVMELKFLPSISELVESCNSLLASAGYGDRIKPWNEAWAEIQKQVHDAFVYKKPVFSTPEIEQAAMCYGWMNLCEAQTDDMQVIHAQVRGIYEDICRKKREKARNNFVINGVLPALKQNDDDEFQKAYRELYGGEGK